ncbi:hypothetical protein RM549_01885 [Salegentibacter sp. F188]|uniref:Uncharacterized protein n=1 Tax=Autumnicola patrickiae TaxID=3075591 RepID=A0ABU3DXS2_9FLAO|nr:hypothetical protein [Salegentibacter sp. F188]MDT0688519.1 hypothetical protein [Salegentibacter sp. F188]
MKLNLPRTNLQTQLLKSRNKRISEEKILQQVQSIFKTAEEEKIAILETLKNGSAADENNFNFDYLESNRIFHISDIEKICIFYRLRFLSTKFFKGDIPHEAFIEIKRLEENHGTSLKGFKILAPSRLFKLKNADDPVLMAPMGNDYFYLVHKWGNDLSPYRKLLMWPFRTIENFAIILLLGSFLLTLLVPDGLFSPRQTTAEFFMIFFFMIKWVAGLAIFFGIKKGKNFSSEIWNSKYYNA